MGNPLPLRFDLDLAEYEVIALAVEDGALFTGVHPDLYRVAACRQMVGNGDAVVVFDAFCRLPGRRRAQIVSWFGITLGDDRRRPVEQMGEYLPMIRGGATIGPPQQRQRQRVARLH